MPKLSDVLEQAKHSGFFVSVEDGKRVGVVKYEFPPGLITEPVEVDLTAKELVARRGIRTDSGASVESFRLELVGIDIAGEDG